MNVIIIGAGIGGLTLALELHDAGIRARVYEAAPHIKPLGVGINILPHASRVLARHGVVDALAAVGVVTRQAAYYNRFGQLIYLEPAGRHAGYDYPQLSLHRGDMQQVLLGAVRDRLGSDAVVMDHICTGVDQDENGARASFRSTADDTPLPSQRADVVIACDGIHSVVRKQFHPDEGDGVYSGVNMWRGATTSESFLTGATMVRAGWLTTGKMVIYPIRKADHEGNQLINWVAEVETPRRLRRDWTREGDLADFIDRFEDWHFDWLDVPALIKATDAVLEYPMVDQDPLDRWSFGRVTLLGDAAHPMVPRGSNGAGQAILDARALREELARGGDVVQALQAYESRRLPATAQVVLANRRNPPDAILREVWQRTGDRPFANAEDVISSKELDAISANYKAVAGYSHEALRDGA
ncbi:flavin-dependent oxidoreductase [Georgenia sp. AZ-5]|uniref:flavin-dependent oxidoreductase n=1 Tax=Georgenia sp. AZ-5 TaxID=3367526 RepID=UPI00375518E8